MNDNDKGQVTRNAAEVYEEFFVPALFQQWPGRVADAANVRSSQRVLDVACGTGILARTVVERVGPLGSVVGLDVNEGMLAVAKRKASQIEWRQGIAEDMPFDNGSFDTVVSQFGLMFFEDKNAAIAEMVRVLRPGGCLAAAVWDSLQNAPGYAEMANLLQRLFGREAAAGLRAPFRLGEMQELRSLFGQAGLPDVTITTHPGTARFPSIQSWVYTEVKGWVLADKLDDAQFELLLKEAEDVLQPFVTDQDGVAFSTPAHIVTFTKP
jgi:ubiquinone/menaquinone biosynthesis C-methylase UbiE